MKYSFKLLFSPVKWIICFVVVVLITVAVYAPTFYDFTNISSIYFPFVGIVLFADMGLLDKESQVDEIVYLINRKPIRAFIERYMLSAGFLMFYVVFGNIVFRILQWLQGQISYEPISVFEYIVIVMESSLFIATIAMTISTIFGNVYVGYSCASLYWLYWNINSDNKMILNPFSFIADPIFYCKELIIVYVIAFMLVLINCFLSTKSPFYCMDKIRRIIIKNKIEGGTIIN